MIGCVENHQIGQMAPTHWWRFCFQKESLSQRLYSLKFSWTVSCPYSLGKPWQSIEYLQELLLIYHRRPCTIWRRQKKCSYGYTASPVKIIPFRSWLIAMDACLSDLNAIQWCLSLEIYFTLKTEITMSVALIRFLFYQRPKITLTSWLGNFSDCELFTIGLFWFIRPIDFLAFSFPSLFSIAWFYILCA